MKLVLVAALALVGLAAGVEQFPIRKEHDLGNKERLYGSQYRWIGNRDKREVEPRVLGFFEGDKKHGTVRDDIFMSEYRDFSPSWFDRDRDLSSGLLNKQEGTHHESPIVGKRLDQQYREYEPIRQQRLVSGNPGQGVAYKGEYAVKYSPAEPVPAQGRDDLETMQRFRYYIPNRDGRDYHPDYRMQRLSDVKEGFQDKLHEYNQDARIGEMTVNEAEKERMINRQVRDTSDKLFPSKYRSLGHQSMV